jgi:hypothetical protein
LINGLLGALEPLLAELLDHLKLTAHRCVNLLEGSESELLLHFLHITKTQSILSSGQGTKFSSWSAPALSTTLLDPNPHALITIWRTLVRYWKFLNYPSTNYAKPAQIA